MLHEEQCLASCPSGYVVEGSGAFNLRCKPTVAAATLPSALICAGRSVVVTGSNPSQEDLAASGQACDCAPTLPDCHECRLARVPDTNVLLGVECIRCKNSNYLASMLDPPSCLASCPGGTIADGQGSFGRSCVPMPIPINDMCSMQQRDSNGEPCLCNPLQECATCELGSLPSGAVAGAVCTVCKGSWYLGPDGVCMSSCPEGYVGFGEGNFNKRCLAVSALPSSGTVECVGTKTVGEGEPCTCSGLLNCHTCEALPDGGGGLTCQVCKSGMLLSGGQCVASCPAGYIVQGEGSFGRQCASEVDTALPTVGTCVGDEDLEGNACRCSGLGDCHTCSLAVVGGVRRAQTCATCKNSAYLLAGECYAACPLGLVESGHGDFGRACVPLEDSDVSSTTPVSTTLFDFCSDPNDAACSCNAVPDCFACNVNGDATISCLACRNSAYLLDATCVQACPAGYVGEGESDLRRRCVRL